MHAELTEQGRPFTETFARLPAEKRAHILRVAKRVFARKGYAVASINEVAREAGVSVGGLYRYFPTKDDLLLTVIESGVETLEAALEEAMSDARDPLERIEAVVRAAILHATRDPEMVRIYIAGTPHG